MKPIFAILFLLLFQPVVRAQTCSGSVGDPIVDITFGSGPTVGPPLPAGTTSNLAYYGYDCPNDGQYTVTNKSSNCFNASWYSLADHTGDSAGYFMLVNASYEPSVFYVQTIDGLCTGTTYQFAVWIANMCNFQSSIRPNITLTIEKTDGTVLSSLSTGNIPVGSAYDLWKQYSINFTIPVGVSTVVLRMRNTAPGGIGNDIAIDDITFRPIGPSISIATSDVTGDSALLCIKDTRNITFHSTVEKCYATTAYQWQASINNGLTWTDIAGANSPDYTRTPVASPGIYLYRLTVAQLNNISSAICRVASERFKIIVYGENVRTISISNPDGAICQNDPVTFKATTTYAGDNPFFQWMVNEIPVGDANDSVFTTDRLANGDVIDCYFASTLPCNDPLTSNAVPVNVLTKAHTSADAFICEGENYEGHTASGIYNDAFPGSNGCDSIRTLNLVVYPKEHTVFDTTICYGTNYSGLTQEGNYDFTYQSIHGCDSVYTISLHVLPDINAKPRFDTLLCTGDSILYSPGGYDNYLWQDGSAGSSYIITHGGSYRVTVSNKCGTAVKNIAVEEKLCIVAFPSAFTPNGDGRNDIFRVVNGYDISRFHFVVYNRWGQKAFETSDPQKGWDGSINAKRAENGVYIWFCDYINRSKPADKVSLKGTVVLMR